SANLLYLGGSETGSADCPPRSQTALARRRPAELVPGRAGTTSAFHCRTGTRRGVQFFQGASCANRSCPIVRYPCQISVVSSSLAAGWLERVSSLQGCL